MDESKDVPEKEWWEGVDTSTMDYLEYGAFEDAMTSEEYQRYINKADDNG